MFRLSFFVKTFNIMLLKEYQKIEKQREGTAARYQTLPNSSNYKSTIDKWTEMGGSRLDPEINGDFCVAEVEISI